MSHFHKRIVALCIAPLVVPLLQLPWLLSGRLSHLWLAIALVLAAITGYIGTLAFATLAYRLLVVPGPSGALISAVTGFVGGALMWPVFLVFFVLSLGQGLVGVAAAVNDPASVMGMLWPGGISGLCVGLIFWSIVSPRPSRHSQSAA